MHDGRRLFQSDPVLVQQDADALGAQGDAGLVGEIPGQERAGPLRLLETIPARVVAHRLDEQDLVRLVPAQRATIRPYGLERCDAAFLEAIEPAVDDAGIDTEEFGDV